MTEPLPRRIVVTAVVAFLAGVCVYAIRQIDADLYGYLAYGRLFAELGGPTSVDPFAYTSAGSRWVAFEYLSQTMLWLVYSQAGPIGLIALKCAIGGAAIAFLWMAIREVTDDMVVAIPIFLVSTSTVSRYFLFRPQLFTFACFALFVFLLFRFVARGRAPLWLLPLVMLFWVNAHGGFLAGLGALGLAIALTLARNLGPRAPRNVGPGFSPAVIGTSALLLLLTFGVCLLVTLATPWGFYLWEYVATELTHDTNRRYIAEWRPAGLDNDIWSAIALTFLVTVLLGVTAMASRGGRRVLGLFPWQWLLTTLPLVVMSYGAVRHVPLAAIWAAPVIALLATEAKKSAALLFRPFWFVVTVATLVPIVLTLQFVAADPRPVIAAGGARLGAHNPCRAVTFMRENGVEGNVFLPLWWGSYVTWEAYPSVRVSMDGRNISAFPGAMVAENLRFYSAAATAEERDAPLKYATDFLLVPAGAAILEAIRSDARWRLMYEDTDASLFVRADPAHASVVSAIAAGTMRPPRQPCSPVLK